MKSTNQEGSSSSTNGFVRRDCSQVECQIYRKKGHYASRCHFRYHPPTVIANSTNSGHIATVENVEQGAASSLFLELRNLLVFLPILLVLPIHSGSLIQVLQLT